LQKERPPAPPKEMIGKENTAAPGLVFGGAFCKKLPGRFGGRDAPWDTAFLFCQAFFFGAGSTRCQGRHLFSLFSSQPTRVAESKEKADEEVAPTPPVKDPLPPQKKTASNAKPAPISGAGFFVIQKTAHERSWARSLFSQKSGRYGPHGCRGGTSRIDPALSYPTRAKWPPRKHPSFGPP